MAAAFGCGFEPAQPVAMHRVFQTASSTSDGPYLQHNDNSVQSLDGAHDHKGDNPFTRSIKKQAIPIRQDDRFSDQKSETVLHAHESSSLTLNNSLRPDADLNFHRRKRPRLSQTNDQLLTEESEKANSNVASDKALLNDTSQIDTCNKEHGIDLDLQPPSHLNDLQDRNLDMVLQNLRRSTPRKGQAKRDNSINHNVDASQGVDPDTLTSPSERKRSTTRKKTLSVHTNGKLLSSPPATSNSTLQPNSDTVTKPASNRNFKMRNGRFVQSLEVSVVYGKDSDSRETVGRKIDAILAISNEKTQVNKEGRDTKTHPFFLGKIKTKPLLNEPVSNQGDTTDNDSETTTRRHEPVPWKDIKFTTQRSSTFKSLDSVRPVWPPLSFQHVGKIGPSHSQSTEPTENLRGAKMKQQVVQLHKNEDILCEYMQRVNKDRLATAPITVPTRHYLSGAQVASELTAQRVTSELHDAIGSIHDAVKFGSSAFDRGECAGPNIWSSQYAPTRTSEVLQPAASVLREWLQGLTIHNVKSGIDVGGSAQRLKVLSKRKKRKQKDEFDDFLADSDDDPGPGKAVRTAILITGPNGCGKTASVFAVARELGFEVFEIHPGMRRGARDIFDKVGDMAYNHLVQNGPDLSRSSSVGVSDMDAHVRTDATNEQSDATNFLGVKKVENTSITNALSSRAKKEQKQSLILFEEVDLLFEDDRGFWSGVQSLIKHSRRPVVLTCNDPASIPVDELDLHDILIYEPVEHGLAVDYLQHVAAAEGHILEREPLSILYRSKCQDLRASITELNLWCQMTVGSKQGGLDWMVQDQQSHLSRNGNGIRLRTFSHGTFQKCLDLMPQTFNDDEAVIRFNHDALGIDAMHWCDFAQSAETAKTSNCNTKLQILSRYSEITEARSAADVMDDDISPLFASVIRKLAHIDSSPTDRDIVALEYTRTRAKVQAQAQAQQLIDALVPITTGKPTFPPSHICLAPSIAIFTSSVATDIAPYVRSIVNFDKNLEERRDEIFGSQGKSRKTRAATAAAEGGDKASTRSERWFPKSLDFTQVLETGGQWPQWYVTHSDEL